MAASKIIKYPASSLRMPTKTVGWPMDQEIWRHVADLHDTLLIEKNGMAIASNQIAEHGWQIFAVSDEVARRLGEKTFINPIWEPLLNSGMVTMPEGCLSFPGLSFNILRYKSIKVRFQNILGNISELELHGFDARMVQHECEHLSGKLFVDQLEKRKQIEVRNEVIKRKKAGRW